MKEGRCKYWRGTVHDTCGADVNIRQLVGGEDLGWATRLPCSESLRSRANGPTAECDKYEEPTAEELAAEEAVLQGAIARMIKCGPLFRKLKQEHRETGGQGTAKCPVCSGKLHWTVSSYNGHLWARCETEGCIAMME